MAVNSGDFVQAAGLLNNLVEQANGDLEHLDMSLYISVGKNYDRESGGGAVTLQSKSITKTPTEQQQQQTVYPDPGFDGLSSVGVTVEAIPAEYVIPSGSVTITQNGTVNVAGKSQAIVNVPTGGDEPALQQKTVTVTPTTQQQQQTVAPDSGFDGLSSVGVTVEAIPSEYVIPSGSVTITENGMGDVSGKAQAIVNVPTGGALSGWPDSIIIKNSYSGGNITFTRIQYSVTVFITATQAGINSGGSSTFSSLLTDGEHIWFRTNHGTQVLYDGTPLEIAKSGTAFQVTMPANFDPTIPLEIK
jgi:hypothetical protein